MYFMKLFTRRVHISSSSEARTDLFPTADLNVLVTETYPYSVFQLYCLPIRYDF